MEGCGGAWNRNVLEEGHRKGMSQSGTWGCGIGAEQECHRGCGGGT